jgi:signal transduction histidine kinase
VSTPLVLQPSLNQFVQQFGLGGGCLVQVDCSASQLEPTLHWLGCHDLSSEQWSKPKFRQHLEHVLLLNPFDTARPFEIMPLPPWGESELYHFCGCAWAGDASRYYFIGWNSIALSQLQHYGISLYAQTLASEYKTESDTYNLQLHKVLQRNRHQLRTPLALISLYVDLLQSVVLDARSQEWMQNLRSAIEDMHVSLNHLTELTSSTEQLDYIDLRQSITHCIQGMQPWIDQKQLTVVYGIHPLWVHVNAWKIRQVLQNLLSNAIAFAPIGGHIAWEWQNFQAEIVIKISDNGPGLSIEDLRSMGTPFYSRRPGGTGLGLSIARQFILDHHGSLWGDNLPDGGAQFCITLPKVPE